MTRRRRSSRGSGEQLRDEIIDTAMALVLQSDKLKVPSIRDVSHAIGVTPPSIYLHFADKDELLDAVCARYFQRLDDKMIEAARDQPTALERLHAQGMAYVRFAVETPLMYQLATARSRDDAGALDEAMSSAAFAHLHRGVQELVCEGLYPEGNTVTMALQLWVAGHGIASMLITRPYLPWGDPETFADTALRAACMGYAVSDLDLTGVLPRQK